MEPLDPADPHRIGPYRLLSRLGAGDTGQVYLARSDRGRTVAVTLVHPGPEPGPDPGPGPGPGPDLALHEEFRARFRQEVAAARRVGGDWTAPFLDADTEAEVPWFATGYVAGPSLRQAVDRDFGPLPPRTVRILATGLAYALRDIHRAGLIHRDLKPSDVLLTLDGPRVIDLGIARARQDPDTAQDAAAPDAPQDPAAPDQGAIRNGELIGSPGFMAPEQVRGEPVTAACDMFRLGAVLAYAATGRPPFGDTEQSDGAAGLLLRVVEAEPDLGGVPADLLDLVRACLLKDPAARPTSSEVSARVGARATVADGRALEPWLPTPLVALLGRHAVALLDREDAGPDRPPPPRPTHPPGYGAGSAAAVAGATGHGSAGRGTAGRETAGYRTTGRETAGRETAGYRTTGRETAGQGAAYGLTPAPPPRPHRAPASRPRRASTAFLAAVAAVVAVASGATVHTVMSAAPEAAPPVARPAARGAVSAPSASPAPPAPPASGAPKPGGATNGPDAETGTTARTAPGAGPATATLMLPDSYAGTWRATSGTTTWHLTLAPGTVGDPVMDLRAEDPGYSCTWRATLLGGDDTVELAGSAVTSGAPPTCTAGGVSRLRLLPDGRLRRELTGSAMLPLTYDRE
ncbi:serine/threonine-protein kinase [Streptomyces sp. NPDC102278]|uniref:serine/threonine-protein kinase n=1 Tax=Streptomyces sp. NPDC102278 TaxID=3366152 RepID=UPI0037F68840